MQKNYVDFIQEHYKLGFDEKVYDFDIVSKKFQDDLEILTKYENFKPEGKNSKIFAHRRRIHASRLV